MGNGIHPAIAVENCEAIDDPCANGLFVFVFVLVADDHARIPVTLTWRATVTSIVCAVINVSLVIGGLENVPQIATTATTDALADGAVEVVRSRCAGVDVYAVSGVAVGCAVISEIPERPS